MGIEKQRKLSSTLLHEASIFASFEALKDIVEADKFYIDSENAQGLTPLGMIALRIYVCEPRISCSWSIREYEEKIMFLLKNGADPTKKYSGGTPAEFIFHGENKNMINMMLNYIENINEPLNYHGETALHIAIRMGLYSTTKNIIYLGADVNRICNRGYSPLYYAALYNRTDFIDLLIEEGGDMKILNGLGEIPLHVACYRTGTKKLVKKCLEHTPDLYILDNDGYTALTRVIIEYICTKETALELIELFLERKFDLEFRDNRGLTPLDWGLLLKIEPIVSLLLRNGARLHFHDNESMPLFKSITSLKKFSPLTKMAQTVLKYLALQVFEGGQMSQKLKDAIDERYTVFNHYSRCYDELKNLRCLIIRNTNLSYYDILTKSIDEVSAVINNEAVKEAFKDIQENYPNYGTDISYKLLKVRRWQKKNKVRVKKFNSKTSSPSPSTETSSTVIPSAGFNFRTMSCFFLLFPIVYFVGRRGPALTRSIIGSRL